MRIHFTSRIIVFDIGGVLIEWDPRHLYRKLFNGDEVAMSHFLTKICSPAWNAQMDKGKPFSVAVAELAEEYPEYSSLIFAYQTRWKEMIAGAIEPTVGVLAGLYQAGYPLYALSNWSAETFPLMRERYAFLDWFEEIVLSGETGLAKPDPAIYDVFLQRTGLEAAGCLFIDDSPENIKVAGRLGFETIHFESAGQLETALQERGYFSSRSG
jgi:2-haloacid dehalogenase